MVGVGAAVRGPLPLNPSVQFHVLSSSMFCAVPDVRCVAYPTQQPATRLNQRVKVLGEPTTKSSSVWTATSSSRFMSLTTL